MSRRTANRYFRLPLAAVLSASLFAMMALVFADVFGRYFFDSSIRGAYEIIQCLMALVVFTGLPLVTQNREHITVGVFMNIGGGRAAAVRSALTDIVSAAIVVFMALRLWDQGVSMAKSGIVIGLVSIPVAPFAYFMSVMSMVTAVVFCVHAGQTLNDLRQSFVTR